MSRTDRHSLSPSRERYNLERGSSLLDLKGKLDGRVLVGDGAMGTLLAERGFAYGHPYDRANLTHPAVVREVHEEYLRAGARVIETNTFLANRLKLAAHDLEDRTREINVEVAQNLLIEAKPLVGGAYPPHAPGLDAPSSRGCHRTDRLKAER